MRRRSAHARLRYRCVRQVSSALDHVMVSLRYALLATLANATRDGAAPAGATTGGTAGVRGSEPRDHHLRALSRLARYAADGADAARTLLHYLDTQMARRHLTRHKPTPIVTHPQHQSVR